MPFLILSSCFECANREDVLLFQLELRKRQMIKNLHVFISKTRLCVRNLPFHLHDTKLRSIFLKAGGPGASITEVGFIQYAVLLH